MGPHLRRGRTALEVSGGCQKHLLSPNSSAFLSSNDLEGMMRNIPSYQVAHVIDRNNNRQELFLRGSFVFIRVGKPPLHCRHWVSNAVLVLSNMGRATQWNTASTHSPTEADKDELLIDSNLIKMHSPTGWSLKLKHEIVPRSVLSSALYPRPSKVNTADSNAHRSLGCLPHHLLVVYSFIFV